MTCNDKCPDAPHVLCQNESGHDGDHEAEVSDDEGGIRYRWLYVDYIEKVIQNAR